MKEEDGDRYKQINERIANLENKTSVMYEKSGIRNDEPSRAHEDRIMAKL